ncbi:MAG: hypothetical protein LBS33_08275 [Streptococcaceae bacterium]|nr:hypothetical protein [Streptococcaceae bacterium]
MKIIKGILKKHYPFLVLFVMSIVYLLPFLISRGATDYEMGDFGFHFSRIIGLSNAWQSPVNFISFKNHGLMMNGFYPWLTLYPAFLFYKLTGSLVIGYKLFIWLYGFLTLLIAYLSFYSIKKSKNVSLIVAILYCFSAIHLATALGAQVGQSLAFTFIPLVFLGIYEIFFNNERKWQLLTIGMSLVIYSHITTTFITAIYIAIIIILLIVTKKLTVSRIISFFKAVILTAIVSASLFLPMLEQIRAQKLFLPGRTWLVLSSPTEVIKGMLNNDLTLRTVGLAVLLATVVTIFYFKHLNKIELGALLLGLSAVFLTTDLFPWHVLESSIFVQIQFAWRINSISVCLLIYDFCSLMTKVVFIKWGGVRVVVLIIIGVVMLTASSAINLQVTKNHQLKIYTDQTLFKYAQQMNYMDYGNLYSGNFKDNKVSQDNLYLLDGKKIKLKVKSTASLVKLTVDNPKDEGNLITPLARYKGQSVVINGKQVKSSLSKFATTQIKVPRGRSQIVISYRFTTLAIISRWISAIGVFILAYLPFSFFKIKKQA